MPFGVRPAPGRACVSRCQAGRQRAPRTGAVVPPGRVPKPPECPADEAGRAGAAQANGVSAIRPGTAWPDLRPRIPPAPSNQRHRLTPLDEQGTRIIGEDFLACITFFLLLLPSRKPERGRKKGCAYSAARAAISHARVGSAMTPPR